MTFSSGTQAIVFAHILQFTLAAGIAVVVIQLTSRKWPHFTFLLCMLALAKCLVPPLITSPAGLFTLHQSVAFSPAPSPIDRGEIDELKRQLEGSSNVHEISAIQHALSSGNAATGTAWFGGLLAIWAIGATLVLVRASWKFLKVLGVLRRMVPAERVVRDKVRQLQDELQIRRNVRILISRENFGPACVGVFRPKLILPHALVSQWSDRLLRPVIAHELIHARRGDVCWGYVQFVAQVVWWFHPLVWWLGRRAELLCERCCDEEVVGSLKCTAADYAESLVRVLELKSVFRPLVVGHQMSPADITGQRLERLLSRCGRFSPCTSRAAWIVVGCLALVTLPGMRWAEVRQNKLYLDAVNRQEINLAIEDANWSKAVELLKPLVDSSPADASALFFMGYALHAGGNVDEAIEYHRRASEFPQTRAIALYNWACALALQGKKEEALERLEESIYEGFLPDTHLGDDPDLALLVNTQRFKDLSAQCQNKESMKLPAKLSFLVRRWTVVDDNGRTIEQNTVEQNTVPPNHASPVVSERWICGDGGQATSINYYHLGGDKWRQDWVDGTGEVIEYEGKYRNGKMRFEGTALAPGGKELKTRMTFTRSRNGTVEQLLECSVDGRTWRLMACREYRRSPVIQNEDMDLQ